MNIEYINAEKKLVSLVSSIGRAPISWQGWKSLYIDLSWVDEKVRSDVLMWSRSVLGSFLKDCEGEAFCSPTLGIHVVCKGLPVNILKEVGGQICDMSENESGVALFYHIYDLHENADDYIQNTLEQAGNSPVLITAHMPSTIRESQEFMDGILPTDRHIRNYNDYIKVLLVEDDPVTRWMVRNALKKDCTFASADTAHKAYDMYSRFQPDIVFLDIGLPDESGKNVLQWIIRNDPGACVVMFSSNDNLDNVSNTLEDGASGFIPKPFLKEQLLHYIHAYETVGSS